MADNKSGSVIIDDKDQFRLPVGRVFWENLFIPQQFDGSKPKYSVTLIFEPDADFSEYKKAVERLMNLPETRKIAIQPGSEEEKKAFSMGLTAEDITYADAFQKSLQKAIKKETDTEKLEKNPFLAGKLVAKASSIFAVPVVGPSRVPITKDDKDLIYRGSYGMAIVSVGIHNKDKFFLRLKGFQKVRDGEPLGATFNINNELFESFTDESGSLAEDDGI